MDQTAFTEVDFIEGRPETLFQASEHPKIFIFWPHGGETLGPRLGYYIFTKRPELTRHIDYMCGNPRAASTDPAVRYIETDLNRSFNPSRDASSYEEKRAQQVLKLIRSNNYDYILDMHTTETHADSFFLINQRNSALDAVIAASPLKRVVILPDEIAQDGLIGQVTNAVSVEYNEQTSQECGVEESMVLIEGLIENTPHVEPQEREFFHVTRSIPKIEDPGLDAKNFELCEGGYYPVLFGQNSYRRDPSKSYLGFAATSREIAVL